MKICSMEYEYDGEGALSCRRFGSNFMLFPTTNPGKEGWYYGRGRLVYYLGYITHGSTETYYIYKGEAEEPAYALHLDESHGSYFPECLRYQGGTDA